jgi:4-hydroxy-L-threonine phosphate dehydrogenase PdxA
MKIAVTIGDPSGIGPEIVLKALPVFKNHQNLEIFGNQEVLRRTAADLKLTQNFKRIKNLIRNCGAPVDFHYGAPDRRTGRSAMDSLDAALESRPDVLITAPIVKDVIRSCRRDFIGHTEYLARFYQTRDFGMMGILRDKRILLLTTHLPLRDVFKNITAARVREKVALLDWGLKKYFAIAKPQIAVAALNPHAFEFSRGEDEKILKGVLAARHRGIRVSGPFSADSLFNRPFDGFLAMYHDPAMIYLKAHPGGLNFTLGLPIIRLSPLYGAALDIAGRSIARHIGLTNAVRAGIKFFFNTVKE